MSDFKEYIVTLYKHEDLDDFYKEMETVGGNSCIPDRAVEVADRRPISRNTHYWLTPEEAEQLKQDPRVWDVDLTPEELGITPVPGWIDTNARYTKDWTTSTAYDRNWGLLRVFDRDHVAGWGSDAAPEARTRIASLDSKLDGLNVDYVIYGQTMAIDAPEFAENTNGTGGTRYFTVNWGDYGSTSTYIQAPLIPNENHETECGSIVLGNTQGWARRAKFTQVPNNTTFYDYVRAWHLQKPINPNTGFKNPTIVSDSYGRQASVHPNDIIRIYYRGTATEGPFTTATDFNQYKLWYNDTGVTLQESHPPEHVIYSRSFTAETADVEDLVAAGVIFVGISHNYRAYIDVPGGPDYNNRIVYNYTSTVTNTTYVLDRYTNRGSWAASTGSILVGALLDLSANTPAPRSGRGPRLDIWAPSRVSMITHFPGFNLDEYGVGEDGGAHVSRPDYPAYLPRIKLVRDPRNPNYFIKRGGAGTSYAAPQVAGLIGLWAELKPDLTPAEALALLQTYGDSTGVESTSPNYGDYTSVAGSTTLALGYAAPTFSISANKSSISNGESVTFTITTTNVPNGSSLYLTEGGTADTSDFQDNSTRARITVNNNSASFTRTLSDSFQGSKTSRIEVRTGGYNGSIQLRSSQLNLNGSSSSDNRLTWAHLQARQALENINTPSVVPFEIKINDIRFALLKLLYLNEFQGQNYFYTPGMTWSKFVSLMTRPNMPPIDPEAFFDWIWINLQSPDQYYNPVTKLPRPRNTANDYLWQATPELPVRVGNKIYSIYNNYGWIRNIATEAPITPATPWLTNLCPYYTATTSPQQVEPGASYTVTVTRTTTDVPSKIYIQLWNDPNKKVQGDAGDKTQHDFGTETQLTFTKQLPANHDTTKQPYIEITTDDWGPPPQIPIEEFVKSNSEYLFSYYIEGSLSVQVLSPTVPEPPTRTYTVNPSSTQTNEGSSLTIDVTTTGVPNGETLYWTVQNDTDDCFVRSGNFTITNNTGSFSVTPTADQLYEGFETFRVSIATDSSNQLIVATTAPIGIIDTSQNPAPAAQTQPNITRKQRLSRYAFEPLNTAFTNTEFFYERAAGVWRKWSDTKHMQFILGSDPPRPNPDYYPDLTWDQFVSNMTRSGMPSIDPQEFFDFIWTNSEIAHRYWNPVTKSPRPWNPNDAVEWDNARAAVGQRDAPFTVGDKIYDTTSTVTDFFIPTETIFNCGVIKTLGGGIIQVPRPPSWLNGKYPYYTITSNVKSVSTGQSYQLTLTRTLTTIDPLVYLQTEEDGKHSNISSHNFGTGTTITITKQVPVDQNRDIFWRLSTIGTIPDDFDSNQDEYPFFVERGLFLALTTSTEQGPTGPGPTGPYTGSQGPVANQKYRYGSSIKNYRAASKAETGPNSVSRGGPQLLRHSQKTHPWLGKSKDAVLDSDIPYTHTGKDVDIIVVDSGLRYHHPEFCNTVIANAKNPTEYQNGNLLNRNAYCGVLDVVLDGPYYIDPAWFDADASNRLETRWDGTIVPKSAAARQWWSSSTYRSNNLNLPEGGINIPGEYLRDNVYGTGDVAPIRGSHGTPVAACVYGRTQGWAFNANKWFLSTWGLSNDYEKIFLIQEIFHRYKPVNVNKGNKNPTISVNSWEVVNEIPAAQGKLIYRGDIYPFDGYENLREWIPFLQKIIFEGTVRHSAEMLTSSITARADNAVNSGIIFVCAAANFCQQLVGSSHPNYNNYYTRTNVTVAPGFTASTNEYADGIRFYNSLNRRGFPSHTGSFIDANGVRVYKVISVGSVGTFIWDEDYTYNIERKARISNYGDAVDCYASGEEVIAAMDSYAGAEKPLSRYDYSNSQSTSTFYDANMDGTSFAAPIAAGLIACQMEINRTWTYADVRSWLNNDCGRIDNRYIYGVGEIADPRDPYWNDKYRITTSLPPIIIYNTGNTSSLGPTGPGSTGPTGPGSTGPTGPGSTGPTGPGPSTVTYTAIPSSGSVNEGSSLTINVYTSVPMNETLYWTIQTNIGDFTITSGNFTLTNGTGSFSVTPTADQTTEGPETFIVYIRTGNGQIVATTGQIQIIDTSVGPQGSQVTNIFTVTNNGVGNYAIQGFTVVNPTLSLIRGSTYQFNVNAPGHPFWIKTAATTGTLYQYNTGVTNNGTQSGVITFSVSYDAPGILYYACQFHSSMRGTIYISSYLVTGPIYTIVPRSPLVNEGSSLTIDVITREVPDNETLYWTIQDKPSDFTISSGTFIITNSSGSFSVTPTADQLTEGIETFVVSIRTGNTDGPEVATSGNLLILDTSMGGLPTYNISSAAVVDEGSSLDVFVNTSNVADGTILYWTIESNLDDFLITSGNFSIDSNSGRFTIFVKFDFLDEALETFTVKIRTVSSTGTVVVESNSIAINNIDLNQIVSQPPLQSSCNSPITLTINTLTRVLDSSLSPMTDCIIDIIGQGSFGYGLVNYSTYPISAKTKILADQIFGIYQDLQLIHEHIFGQTSSTVITIQTGTVANIRIERPPVTNLIDTSTWIDLAHLYNIVMPKRYNLAVSQRSTYTNALGQVDSLFTDNTTSTNTQTWGQGTIDQDIYIRHKVLYKWASSDLARYFFNTGGEIRLRTSQNNLSNGAVPSKPIDRAWSQFLSSSTIFENFAYKRDEFFSTSSTHAFVLNTSSATIQVIIDAIRLFDFSGVELTASYGVKVGGWISYDDGIVAPIGAPEVEGNNNNSSSGSTGGSKTNWWTRIAVVIIIGGFRLFSAICAKLGELGLMDKELLKGDALFSERLLKICPEAITGYHAWAWWIIAWMDGQGLKVPFITANTLKKWTRSCAVYIATPVAKEMSFRAGHYTGSSSWAGKLILDTALWACAKLGKDLSINHRFKLGWGKLVLVIILTMIAGLLVFVNNRTHKVKDPVMIFNTTQEEFYQRWQDLSESDRQRLWRGLSLDALFIVKKLLPEEPLIDELIDFKRAE
jgi:hypothetical protein